MPASAQSQSHPFARQHHSQCSQYPLYGTAVPQSPQSHDSRSWHVPSQLHFVGSLSSHPPGIVVVVDELDDEEDEDEEDDEDELVVVSQHIQQQ